MFLFYNYLMKKILFLLIVLFLSLPAFSSETGIASWYTADRPNALTANGEVFDNNALSAAHKTLTFGSIVEVTNLNNDKTIQVRINDRGPYLKNRIIDLTPTAAKELGYFEDGVAEVSITVINEPEVPESKYIRGEETGWYTIQIGVYTNVDNLFIVYNNIKSLELKPTIEIVADKTARISIENIQSYKLDQVLESLVNIGITEPLIKGCKNPYL